MLLIWIFSKLWAIKIGLDGYIFLLWFLHTIKYECKEDAMLIELQEATKIYPMGEETICAMDHISFGIKKGEFLSIIGCSG